MQSVIIENVVRFSGLGLSQRDMSRITGMSQVVFSKVLSRVRESSIYPGATLGTIGDDYTKRSPCPLPYHEATVFSLSIQDQGRADHGLTKGQSTNSHDNGRVWLALSGPGNTDLLHVKTIYWYFGSNGRIMRLHCSYSCWTLTMSLLPQWNKNVSRKSLWQLGRSSTVNHHIKCEDAGGGNAEAVEIVKARIFFFTYSHIFAIPSVTCTRYCISHDIRHMD